MTVAYGILSHTAPAQVLRLVTTLRAGSGDGHVLVHHDPEGPPLDRGALRRLDGVGVLDDARPVSWGDGSQLRAQLRLIAAALETTSAGWVVLLSGQDYPARPVRAIEADLADSGLDGYVDGEIVVPRFGRDTTDEWTRRYFCHWRPAPRLGRAGRRAVGALRPLVFAREMPTGPVLGLRARRTPFGPALPCRRGQDWLTLSRRAAEALLDAVATQPQLLRHYDRTLQPTESLPHTVLHARPELRLSGDSHRFLRFAPGSAHPAVLGVGDTAAILASGTDFARKFDAAVDARVLDELDEALT